jgi:hypothetical protein
MSGFPEDFPTLSRQIQSVADYLFGLTHQGEVIELSKIANETEIDSANAARLLRKMAAKEIIDIDGQNVRLMGLGVSLYEERCIPEFVLGLHFSLEKYRGAVVRIIVGKVEGGEAAGTGFFVSAPPNRIITNRHVVSGRTILTSLPYDMRPLLMSYRSLLIGDEIRLESLMKCLFSVIPILP